MIIIAAGDVQIFGPFPADDLTEIDAGLTVNSIVVADDITVHVLRGNVYYTVIKAA